MHKTYYDERAVEKCIKALCELGLTRQDASTLIYKNLNYSVTLETIKNEREFVRLKKYGIL